MYIQLQLRGNITAATLSCQGWLAQTGVYEKLEHAHSVPIISRWTIRLAGSQSIVYTVL
jgi:hypothetical protein